MNPERISERAGRVESVYRSGPDADVASLRRALVDVREITSWAAARQAGLIAQLSKLEACPVASIADAAKTSIRSASATKERSDTLSRTPRLGAQLEGGAITVGHADAVTRVAKQFDTNEERTELLARADDLSDAAAAMTTEEFARRLRLEANTIRRNDGMARYERQQRAARLRSWTDDDGMWNLSGRFDPVLGVKLNAAIASAVEALFAEAVPEFCPTDPIEKQKFLAAHALARLITNSCGSGGPGRAEYVVVVDADAPSLAGPVAEWPIPVEVPARVLATLMGEGRVETVVVRNGVVLHAPGELMLGRTTRLANRAQRRALRGLYSTCAMPGCSIHFDRCKLHHVVWWRHGGRTDLDNLLPVCSMHHSRIHNDGWTVTLGSRRELTVTKPDGTVRCTGPPNRRSA
jgi:hypothetical protein